jgi:hypothetical protein
LNASFAILVTPSGITTSPAQLAPDVTAPPVIV